MDPAYIAMRLGLVHHTHDTEQGLLVDFDKEGNMLGVEILEPLFVTVGGESLSSSRAGNRPSSTESENDVIPDENPQSMEVRICTKCDLRWEKHVDRATRTYWDDEGDKHIEHRQVTLLDCIELLKLANQGPMGYPGPVGMAGIQGPKGDKGDKGEDSGTAFPYSVTRRSGNVVRPPQDGSFRYVDDPE